MPMIPTDPKTLQNWLPPFPGPAGLVKYVVVELDVARENHVPFQANMLALTDLMFSFKKWELVFAAYPITGVVNRFLHIWKIPSEDTIIEIMRAGALAVSDKERTKAKQTVEEQFRSVYHTVQGMITRTNHTLMTSLSYDPENVGYQTQTILIDANRKPYLIYHSDLRSADARAHRITRLADAPAAHAQQDKQHAALPLIRDLLNRGITDARIKVDGAEALLFNLAGLRPKTIFEDLSTLETLNSEGTLAATGSPKEVMLPGDVKRLLLAMPDGEVFELGQKQVQGIARQIPSLKAKRVAELVKRFTDGKIPLASLPNDRQEIIGDGCACYVINLNSFAS